MDFALSANQESIRDAVAKICSRFDDAYWLKKDKEGGYPSDFHKALADAGWLGICIPEEYGGSALGITDAIPRWLVILVVSRDIMIVSAVILSWVVDKPVPLKPLRVSKLNTVAQIALAAVVLAALGFEFDAEIAVMVLMGLVTILTLLSVAFYVAEWVRHMNAAEKDPRS